MTRLAPARAEKQTGLPARLGVVALEPGKIRASEYNPRKISEFGLSAIRQSIERFGFVDPVVVNRRQGGKWGKRRVGLTCVGGHQRLKVACQMGLETVPAVVLNLGPGDEEVLNLALNNGGAWDLAALASLLGSLRGLQKDLDATGFSKSEIDQLVAKAAAEAAAPAEFPQPDVDADHRCPGCSFEWRGKCKP